eukprot:758202-Karenia_brevis.AAC.1
MGQCAYVAAPSDMSTQSLLCDMINFNAAITARGRGCNEGLSYQVSLDVINFNAAISTCEPSQLGRRADSGS